MKIRLRFIAIDPHDLPPRDENGCLPMDVAEGLSVDRVLELLALPDDATYLTLVNEDSVPIAKRPARHLREGDLLTIFSPLKGG